MLFTGICLITDDVTRLSKFYQEVLHVKAEGDEVHTEIKVEGSYFAIYSKQAANQDMSFGLGDVYGTGNVTLMFVVDDVDQEYERLKPFVNSFITEPKTYPWGARAVHFKDPDGNIVDFMSPPKA